ncbi:MAG: hypothetical protein RMK51_05080 [Meiothermus sp.]|uniref:hypothetical protein n=1 Tax=Meiothermus sp. TaxID=1955249 RepID=UPI0025DAF880|nr:hypothetical protein [Meiothermus sp.]MCS7069112.1 hypothetical protein [Meiothermus sp.]MCX7740483.1 hypothetical protein [Meiothermus sp.]MDW8425286.1 hypothetical protein [Meiothermus sp.]
MGLALGVYFLLFKRYRFQGIGSIPFAAIGALLYLAFALQASALYTVGALGAVMALWGLLVLTGRWWHR